MYFLDIKKVERKLIMANKKVAKKNSKALTPEMIEDFQKRLQELKSLAKKKNNILEYNEISDFFEDMQLDADKFELVLDYL